MGSLIDIYKRIRTVKSTEKITKAMKMIAASKLRLAQENVQRSRPFALKLEKIIAHLAHQLALQGKALHPLLQERPYKKRIEVLLLTSSRGLCGSFNSNVVKKAEQFLWAAQSAKQEVVLSTLGKKGLEVCGRMDRVPHRIYEIGLEHPQFFQASEIALDVAHSFMGNELDGVFLIYNEFKNVISQKVVVKQMLPIIPAPLPDMHTGIDFLYEPSQEQLLDELMPRHLATKLYQAFLESEASEQAARMLAMDNATRNANEMISKLALEYNRMRQSAITNELMEIIGGAEALR